jgi:hypothetical protein
MVQGEIPMKINWEDQEDDWCDHETILREAAAWREQLAVEVNPVVQL